MSGELTEHEIHRLCSELDDDSDDPGFLAEYGPFTVVWEPAPEVEGW